MIVGLFTSVLGKRSAEENKGGATSDGGHVAVLDPPAASPTPAAQPAPAAQQVPIKAAPSGPGATLQADGSKPEVKACPQCGSTEPWGISSWCPNCFYHPRMGQVVITTPPPDPEVRHLVPGHSHQAASYAAMFQSIPLWAHPLWIGVISIFLLSVYMGIKLPKFGYERAVWTLVQAGLGLTAAATAHVLVFFKTIPNTDKYGPFDLLMKPLDFWRYAAHKLPSGAWRLWMFAWGLTAAVSALVLIGGINYSAMFETKSTKKKTTWYQTSQIAPAERRVLSA
ncbi:MAG TPA: hypothetical protein VG055_12355 [Planctomycetaceae bacterium]|jgi:hypothetical protein|nr:hypothetical protein [Planctomycetaceae bacterium]